MLVKEPWDEIHGKTMRGIDFISCTFMSREDIAIFAGSCNEIKMTLCYQEGKNLKLGGNWLNNKYGARNLLKVASSIQMYQHSKYAIDTSPNYPRESGVTRYTAASGVWENNSALDEDYENVRYISNFGKRLRRSSDNYAIKSYLNTDVFSVGGNGDVVNIGRTTSSGFNTNKQIVLTGTGLDSRILSTSNNTDISVWVTKDGSWSPSFRAVGSTGDLQVHSNIVPALNNSKSVGEATTVFSTAYLGSSPVVSSDERLKQQFTSLDVREKAAALEIKSSICKYKFNHAVDLKGDGARWHVGVKAQEVVSILESHALNPFDYGFVCFDEWDEQEEIIESWDDEFDESGELVREAGSHVTQEYRPAGSRYAIRYDELAMFLLSVI